MDKTCFNLFLSIKEKIPYFRRFHRIQLYYIKHLWKREICMRGNPIHSTIGSQDPKISLFSLFRPKLVYHFSWDHLFLFQCPRPKLRSCCTERRTHVFHRSSIVSRQRRLSNESRRQNAVRKDFGANSLTISTFRTWW